MNKFNIITKSVAITVSVVSVAHAGLNNWTGLYAGVNGGLAFKHIELTSQQLGFTSPSETCNDSSNFSTFSPGVQLGYLYQLSNYFVSGIEASANINADQIETLGCNSNINPDVYDRFTFRNQLQASIKGRIGRIVSWHNQTLLPYFLAGGSFADVGLTYKNEGGDYYSKHAIKAGWLIGAGIEWPFKTNWSMRAEYTYANDGNINLKIPAVYGLEDPNGNGRVKLKSQQFLVGINYWF